jgi:hypothetical protein
MILIDQAVKAKLRGLASVQAVCGQKIYPDFVPQRVAPPFGTFQQNAADRLPYLSIGSNGRHQSAVKIDTFRIEFYSDREYDVARIRMAIDRELGGAKANGRWNDGADQGPIVTFCTIDDATGQVDRSQLADDEHPRAVVCLLTVTWYDEEQS